MSTISRRLLLITVLLIITVAAYAQREFTLTRLPASSTTNAVNNVGQVVGTQNGRAFVWQNGSLTFLPSLAEGRAASAEGINNAGQVVGWALDSNAQQRAVMWDQGTIRTLGEFLRAHSINDRGQVVVESDQLYLLDHGAVQAIGQFSCFPKINNRAQVVCSNTIAPPPRFAEAVIWQNGRLTILPDPGLGAVGLGINDSGQAVGAVFHPGYQNAALWTNGVLQELTPDVHSTQASSINSAGDVVGLLTASDGSPHPALWVSDTLFDLNSLIPASDRPLTGRAMDISNSGYIVGVSGSESGSAGFILVPK